MQGGDQPWYAIVADIVLKWCSPISWRYRTRHALWICTIAQTQMHWCNAQPCMPHYCLPESISMCVCVYAAAADAASREHQPNNNAAAVHSYFIAIRPIRPCSSTQLFADGVIYKSVNATYCCAQRYYYSIGQPPAKSLSTCVQCKRVLRASWADRNWRNSLPELCSLAVLCWLLVIATIHNLYTIMKLLYFTFILTVAWLVCVLHRVDCV